VAAIGNGNILEGATAAGINELVAQNIGDVLPDNAFVNNLVSTMIGGAIGGTEGALIAGSADKFNRQLHQTEMDWIQENAEGFAKQLSEEEGREVTEQEAQQRLARELLSQVDSDWNQTLTAAGYANDEVALNYLAEGLTSLGELYIPNNSDIPLGIGQTPPTYTPEQIKSALQNYSNNNSESYNNALENADDFGVVGSLPLISSEKLEFYKRYVALPSNDLTEQASAGRDGHRQGSLDALGGAVDGTQVLLTALIENPEDTLTAISNGVIK
jgi:gas vesicle protein